MAVKPFVVDGTQIPNPSTFNPILKDLDSADGSFTSDTGYLVRDMIRGNQATFNVSWDRLDNTQLSNVLKAISGTKSNPKDHFTLKYWDVIENNYSTGTFYATDRNVEAILLDDSIKGHFKLSVNFIEF